MATKLSVNLNKVALLRNSREGNWPDPVFFGRIALEAGAAGITVHPRPDERHIRALDVAPLADLVAKWPNREYNIEGNPFHNLMDHIRAVRPDQATFVPDSMGQLTSDHGFALWDEDVCKRLIPLIKETKDLGVRVSLFMDPNPEWMQKAKDLGADRIELYTEGWAKAFGTAEEDMVLESYRASAQAAKQAGLGVNAGHDLDLENLGRFLSVVKDVDEVSIGHALTAESLQFGMAEVVKRYNNVINGVFNVD